MLWRHVENRPSRTEIGWSWRSRWISWSRVLLNLPRRFRRWTRCDDECLIGRCELWTCMVCSCSAMYPPSHYQNLFYIYIYVSFHRGWHWMKSKRPKSNENDQTMLRNWPYSKLKLTKTKNKKINSSKSTTSWSNRNPRLEHWPRSKKHGMIKFGMQLPLRVPSHVTPIASDCLKGIS